MAGKCPKCERSVPSAKIEDISLSAGPGYTKWNGSAYTCPSCQTILGVQIDPIALKTDTVNAVHEILKKLGR